MRRDLRGALGGASPAIDRASARSGSSSPASAGERADERPDWRSIWPRRAFPKAGGLRPRRRARRSPPSQIRGGGDHAGVGRRKAEQATTGPTDCRLSASPSRTEHGRRGRRDGGRTCRANSDPLPRARPRGVTSKPAVPTCRWRTPRNAPARRAHAGGFAPNCLSSAAPSGASSERSAANRADRRGRIGRVSVRSGSAPASPSAFTKSKRERRRPAAAPSRCASKVALAGESASARSINMRL